MQHIDIRKKRPSQWPWIAGIVVLLLVLWGVSTLLRSDEPEEAEAIGPTVEDTHPPAAIPTPPREAGSVGPIGLGHLAPLGSEDVGEALEVKGVVVATGNDAFWIVADGDVLRVDSRRDARRGDTIVVSGTLQSADPDKTDRMTSVLERNPGSEEWTIVRALKLVEEASDSGAPADRILSAG